VGCENGGATVLEGTWQLNVKNNNKLVDLVDEKRSLTLEIESADLKNHSSLVPLHAPPQMLSTA